MSDVTAITDTDTAADAPPAPAAGAPTVESATSHLAYGPTEWDDHDVVPPTTGLSNEKMTMWAFLASDCLLFGALISAYLLLRNRTGPATTGPTAADLFDIPFTSVSSFVLLMSSLTMVLAVSSVARREMDRCRLWLLATAALGAVFVSGQVYEFTSFLREGLGFTVNASSSSFYTLTGFHGVHVSVGIVMLVTLVALIRAGFVTADNAETIEIIGLYWHFVDIVWIVIFAVVYLIP